MSLVPAKCPQCGAAIQIPDEVEKANCMYCGTTLLVKEALKQNEIAGPDAKRLIELGETSLEAGRSDEAYNYFTRAIEADATLATPWYGKAKASWGQATLNDTRKDELVLCCNKYVELSNRDNESLTNASVLLSSAATGLSNVAFNHFTEYGGTLVGQMGSAMAVTNESETIEWINRLFEAVMLHIEAVNYATEAGNGQEQAIEKMLDSLMVFVDNCYFVKSIGCHAETNEGRKIHTTSSNVLLKGMDEQARRTLLNLYATYQKRLVGLNSSFTAKYQDLEAIFKQQNEKASSSGLCFVATACYGTPDAENIVTLRAFRDSVLRTSILGRIFIEKYYKYGPYFADMIRGRWLLMFFGRTLICTPSAKLAKLIMKNSEGHLMK